MACQARVLDEEFKIPGISDICHTTKECGLPANKKASVDDGDASFRICMSCVKRRIAKQWYGWYDCEYPADAHVKYSPWYYDAVKRGLLDAETDRVIEQIDKIVLEESRPPVSKKEMLQQKIQEIDHWMKGEGKTKYKEQVKMLRESMKLKAELTMLK